jgi:hypothetical protein
MEVDMTTIEFIAALTPFFLLLMSGIGWMIKRMFDDAKERRAKQEARDEMDNRLIETVGRIGDRLGSLEETMKDVRTQTLKLEFLQLIKHHPDEATSISKKYDKLKKLGQNSYLDTEFAKWRKEQGS